MSLYDKASLVMIPSGYKDDKLYSIKPTSGDGDFTFSRDGSGASPATRVNASGLIEKGRENVLLQSNQFDTTWVPSAGISVTGGQSGYDGSSDAWLLKRVDTSARYISQNITLSNAVYSYSVYAKAESVDWLYMWSFNGTGSVNVYFDLANGLVGTQSGTIDANIESVGGGWYRCSMSYNNNIAAVRLYPAVADGSITGGVAPAGVFIQDAQLEQGLVATSYIETTTTAVSDGLLGDMPRLDYSGGASCPSLLLEPSRTNLFTQSEYFDSWVLGGITQPTLTANYSQSPEGLQNAYRVQLPNIATDSLMAQIVSHTSGTDMTISAWVKSASGSNEVFKLYGDYGTPTGRSSQFTATSEWQRFTFTFTPTATGSRGTGLLSINNTASDLLVYAMQIEAGSYATSYIPTYGSATARAVDQLETSPYDYQSQGVLGANVGTIILDCETIATSTGSNDFHMFGAAQSIADGYLFRANTGTTIDILERDSNGTSAQWTGIAAKQTRNKIGVSYSGADVDIYVNGVAKSVSSGTPVGGGNINGFSNSGSNKAGLIIHQILLFPTKLTDSEMANITTL